MRKSLLSKVIDNISTLLSIPLSLKTYFYIFEFLSIASESLLILIARKIL